MTRSTPEFDQRIADWLEADPSAAPGDVLSTVVAAIPSIPQARRGFLAPWRFDRMPTYLRLAAAAAIVAVVGVGALSYLNRAPGFGSATPQPTVQPTPTAAPTVVPTASPFAFDPYTWTTYRSEAYGYTTEIPSGWNVEQAASRQWDPTVDVPYTDQTSPAVDIFTNEDGDVAVSIWRVPVDPGSTQEFRNDPNSFIAWAKGFCESTDYYEPCTGIAERAIEMCHYRPDCSPDAMIVPFDQDVLAFFGSSSDELTVVQVWRVDTDPEVAEYGGAIGVMKAFLDPLNVRLAPPGDG